MRFIVEDGTGLPLSNAFVDVHFVDQYSQEMGKESIWGVLFNEEGLPETLEKIDMKKKQAIVQASRWLGNTFYWKGKKIDIKQGLAFPREIDNEKVMPYEVKEATASAAIRIFAGEVLTKDESRGGLIKSVKAGPVAVTYADSAPSGKQYKEIEDMIKEFAYGIGGAEFITTSMRIG